MKMYLTLLAAVVLAVPISQGAEAPAPLPLTHMDHPYQRVETLFAAVPSGTNLDQSQFERSMGADAAEYLHLFGITSIESLDGAFRVTLTTVYNGRTQGGSKIQIDRLVTFTYKPGANGSLACEKISGIRVKPRWVPFWMPLQELIVTKDAVGNTVFEAQVEALGMTVNKITKIDEDGKIFK